MRAINLKTNHLTVPLGMDAGPLFLSWQCVDGVRQTAYEIELTANGETVWHSGKVQSAAVHADAPTVGGSRVRGCWRVRLWDENDTPGAWSEAHFETGLAQSDWQGEWVDPETEEIDIPGDDAINAFARPNWERKQAEKEAAGKGAAEPYKPHRPASYLRKTFTAAKGEARLYITAKGLYAVWLNGVRRCLPQNCGYILDELLHAHFEDHDKDQYYGEIIESIIRYDRADAYIIRFCEVIKRLAVDRLHIVGDLFDRGPRPDRILDSLMAHHQVDIQWGNHDVVWMGAAAGSPLCIMTVLKTTLAYNNLDTLEGGYGISLRRLERFAQHTYADSDVSRWLPHADQRTAAGDLTAAARMHKAVTVMMLKLEAQVIARNPDFDLQGRDFLNHIDFAAGTVDYFGTTYPLLDCDFPTVDPANPAALTADEEKIAAELVRSFAESERLQRHVQFLYAHGAFYKMCNGNLLYHGAVPMTEDGAFAAIRFEGTARSGKQLFDYCDRRARQGYSAPAGSPARLAGQDFLWYLWCGAKSPLFGRSAMTTFERLYIADPAAQVEIKDPYYRHIADPRTAEHILREFGLSGEGSHIVNGHVPVRAIEGESPIKGGGRLIIIDGGFCRAYHRRTGIAGYTLVYNSRGLILRTHQPFESVDKAIHEDEDIASKSEYIYTAPQRILVRDTDEGGRKQALIRDLTALVEAYQSGVIAQGVAQEM